MRNAHRQRSSRSCHAVRSACAATALSLAAAAPALALPNVWDDYTATGTGNWFDAANWSAGVPTLADAVRFSSNGTANIAAGNAAANSLTIGAGAGTGGTVNLSGTGTLTTIYDVKVGDGAGAVATFNQSGGALRIPWTRGLWLGSNGGTGTYTLSGGTAEFASPFISGTGFADIIIGNGTGGSGNLVISGGTMTGHGIVQIGRGTGSSGTLSMTGGTLNIAHDFWGGWGSTGGQATINQSGGTINTGTDNLWANGVTSAGIFELGVGNPSTARSTYTLSGTGVLNVNSYMFVGGTGGNNNAGNTGGYADFVLDGGTVNIGGANNRLSSLYIGNSGTNAASAAAEGTVTVRAGTLILDKAGAGIAVGQRANSATAPDGTGTLTITGGEVLVPSGSVIIGRANGAYGATGTVNLSGTGRLVADALVMVKASDTDVSAKAFNFTGGTLDLNSATSDFVLTNNGGTLRPGGTAARVMMTAGADGSYDQAAGTLAIELASNSAYDGLDTTGGTVGVVSLAGGVTVTAGAGYNPTFGAAFPVITAKSVTDAAAWTLPSLPAGFSWDRRVIADGANSVEALVVVRSASTGVAPGAWTGGAANASFKLGGTGGTATVGAGGVTAGHVQLDAGGSAWTIDGAGTLTLSASGAPAGIVAFGGAHTVAAPLSAATNSAIATVTSSTAVTLAGAVSGSSTIEKTGPGTLALTSGSSSFTGTWSVSGGTLNINDDGNLGAAGAKLSFAGGTLNVAGGWNSSRAIELRGTGATVNVAGDSSLGGAITGPGGLSFNAGTGTVTLGGANTYVGPTVVNVGNLAITSGAALPATTAVTLAPSTQLLLNGHATSVGSLASSGTSSYGNVVTGGADLTVGSNGQDAVLNGQIQGGGVGTFIKAGTGTQVINAGAALDGLFNVLRPVDVDTIRVQAGKLQVSGLTVATGGLGPIDLPANEVAISSGATLAVSSKGTSGRIVSYVTGNGTLEFLGGTTAMDSANPDFTGSVMIRNTATVTIGDMGAFGPSSVPVIAEPYGNGSSFPTLKFATGGTFSHATSIDRITYHVNSNGNAVTLDQPITGNGQLYFEDSATTKGSITLAAKNTYDGATNVHPAGSKVILAVDDAIPTSYYTINNGTIDLNGHDLTLGSLLGAQTGADIIVTAGNTLSLGADDYDSNSISTSYSTGYKGKISGAGGLTKVGYGIQCLSGTNTYTGPTVVKTGALWFNALANQIPATSGITVEGGALLILGYLKSGTTTAVFDKPVGGAGRVQKNNNDLLELTADNTYAGGTTITAGTLILSKDANLGAPAGPVTFYLAGTSAALRLKAAFDTARPVVMANGLGTVDTNGFDTAFSGPVSGPGSLTKAGVGRMALSAPTNAIGGTLSVTGGTLALSGKMTAGGVNASGGQLDLGPTRLVVDYAAAATSPADALRTQLLAGRNGGTWDGATGVMTAAAQTTADAQLRLAVGYGEASKVLGLTDTETADWDGRAVDATSVLTRLTWYGDADLDGVVDADDYVTIDRSLAFGGFAGTARWTDGDFDYSGTVDDQDYLLIDRVFVQSGGGSLTPELLAAREAQFGPGYTAALVAAVPEPTGITTTAAAAAGLLGLRRRRRHG